MSSTFTKYLELSLQLNDDIESIDEIYEYNADDLEFETIPELIEFLENTDTGIIVDDLYHPTRDNVVLFEKGTTINEIHESKFFKRHSNEDHVFSKYIKKIKV